MSNLVRETDAQAGDAHGELVGRRDDATATPSPHRLVVCVGGVQRSYLEEESLRAGRLLLLDETCDALVRVTGVNGFVATARLQQDEGGFFLQFVEASP